MIIRKLQDIKLDVDIRRDGSLPEMGQDVESFTVCTYLVLLTTTTLSKQANCFEITTTLSINSIVCLKAMNGKT